MFFFTETFLSPALKIWLLKKGHDMNQNQLPSGKKQRFDIFDWVATC